MRKSTAIAIGVIVIACILAVGSSWNDSIIVDEDPHIGAGYSYLAKRDMRLNPEHPPFPKDIAAIPLLFLNLKQDAFETSAWQSDVNGQWDFGRALIFNTGNDADMIARAAKAAMLVFFIGAAIIIFAWTRELYGARAGLIALTLFAFSPTILAHSRFVTTDVPALFGVLSATYFVVRYLKNPTRLSFWLATVFFGLALLMKFSTVLLVPFFLALAWRKFPRAVFVMLAGFILITWPIYYVQITNYPPERQHRDTEQLLQSFGNRALAEPVIWASDKPVIRAAAQYGLGLLMVIQRNAGGNTVYYRGETLNAAGPSYFPFVYAIKEPLPWLILLAITVVLAISKFKISNLKSKIDEKAMLLWLVIYWATSINSSLNIGIRHLMPVYPFMIMLVAGQVARFFALRFILYALLAWYIVENLVVYPHYLTYFNQLAGGPSGGYRYVVDSNLDWGQDLKRLSQWAQQQNIEHIDLDYFGWADPSYYLGERYRWISADTYVDLDDFLARNQSDGWLAVSATFLQNNRSTRYSWLADLQPVTVIGNSIFVYHL